MRVSEIIKGMLTENTGTHFLDSGGSNGRMWQRNQEVDFENEPRVTFDDEYPNVSLYHYLNEVLDTDEISDEINRVLEVRRKDPDANVHWVQDCIEVVEILYEIEELTDVFNTYNGECFLSQTCLYQCFEYDGEHYIALQVHGGADVRGGYTDTKVFRLNAYFDHTPNVYGTLLKLSGESIEVESGYCGYKMTTEEGEDIEIEEGEQIVGDFFITEF